MLESQDVFSVQNDDNGVPVMTLDPCNNPGDLGPQFTDEDIVAPVAQAAAKGPLVRKLDFGAFEEESLTSQKIDKELLKLFYFFLTACNVTTLRFIAKDLNVKTINGEEYRSRQDIPEILGRIPEW